jgi:hypothetical protein
LEGLQGFADALTGQLGLYGTGWTMMFRFNAVMYTILAVQALLAVIAVFAAKLRGLVGFCNCCCTNVVFLVMAIMGLVYRFDSFGDACAMDNRPYDAAGNSFFTDGATFSSLSIASICLVYVYCCCTACSVGQRQAQA